MSKENQPKNLIYFGRITRMSPIVTLHNCPAIIIKPDLVIRCYKITAMNMLGWASMCMEIYACTSCNTTKGKIGGQISAAQVWRNDVFFINTIFAVIKTIRWRHLTILIIYYTGEYLIIHYLPIKVPIKS